MSWFSIADYAKNALSEAQKKIDKALDIQAKNDDTSGSKPDHNEGTANIKPFKSLNNTIEKSSNYANKQNADAAMKKKVGVTKPKNSTVKKISNEISDDFFSILEDGDRASTSPRPKPSTRKNVIPEVKGASMSLSDKAETNEYVNTCSDQTIILSTEEISSKETNLPIGKQIDGEVSQNMSESTYSEVTLVAGSDSAEDNSQDSDVNEEVKLGTGKTNHPVEIENTLPEVSDPTKAVEIKPTAVLDTCEPVNPQESSTERTISPTVSTAASSEIDILDHESVTSELSSKYDGQIILQSPFHVRNVDALDSDASQALSPVPDGKDTDNFYQPSRNEDTQLSGGSIPSYSFQPLKQTDEKPSQVDILDKDETDMKSSEISTTSVNKDSQIETKMEFVENQFNDATNSDSVTQERVENSTKKIVPVIPAPMKPTNTNEHFCDNYTTLSEKMEVYEQQLMTLSCKNAQLNEENDNLRSEISRTKNKCKRDASYELEQMEDAVKSGENSNRLLKDENANLLKQLAVIKSQLASRMTNDQVQNAIAEKEDSIKGLMEEGEALAKKHLQQNNLIKKLKSQAQERETELKNLKQKATNFESENTKLKNELKEARGQGQEERETSLRISDAYEQRERETQILQEKLSQSEEKQRTFQVNLDAAYKEIGDLHKQMAEYESKCLTEWKSKEEDLRRESDIEKKKIASEQEHQRQLLLLQIMELNNSVERVEAANARKEDDHRREIREFQQRIQESEGRNQDLSDNVSSATRPLLRQIENLQATHSSQQRSWNALEKTLNSRIGEAHAELLAARENERVAQSSAMEAKSRSIALDKHIENNKTIISRQTTEIESLRKQVEDYKEQTLLLTEELEGLKMTHNETVHKSRKERLFLENQLQMEKVRSEAERKKYMAQQEALQKERLMWSRSEVTSVSSNQVVETESVGSSNDAFHATDTFEKQLGSTSIPGLMSQRSFNAGKSLSMSNVLENLQTQLKLRDGEIAQLRGDINMLDRTRSSMAEEIVRLTNLTEDLENLGEELKTTKEELAEVESRYSAILTMYGEKEEENEELRMDLIDVKAMYRQQINDLLTADPS